MNSGLNKGWQARKTGTMKHLLLLILLLITSLAFADEPSYSRGAYGFLTVGHAYNHFTVHDFNAKSAWKKDPWVYSGRIGLGFNIDPYIGIESGYFHNLTRKLRGLNGGDHDAKIDQTGVDIFTVIRLPIFSGFNLHGKIGSAYVNTHLSSDGNQFASAHRSVWQPAFGLGFSYNSSSFSGLSLTADFEHINHNADDHFPALDMYSIGVLFHF